MNKFIFILLFLFSAVAANAQATLVQSTYCSTTAAAKTLSCAFTSAVKAGDAILLFSNENNTGGTAYTISATDTVNGAYTLAQSCSPNYIDQGDALYHLNAAAGSPTVTVTSSTSTGIQVSMYEFSSITAIDVSGSCTPEYSGTTATAPSITTTAANDLVVCADSTAGTPFTTTVSSPYTLKDPSGTGADLVGYQTATSAGSITGATFTTSAGYSSSAVRSIAFKTGSTTTALAHTQVGAFAVGP